MLKTYKAMAFAQDEEKEFKNSNICHNCQDEIEEEPKVREHGHLTGKYRGAANQSCILNLKVPSLNPVFLHENAIDDRKLLKKKNSHCFPTEQSFGSHQTRFLLLWKVSPE